jgi:DNA-binding NarL/FixJ family response regulator
MSRCGNPHLDTRRAVCYCICNSVNCAASHGARRVSVPRPAAPVLTALPAAPPPDALLVLTDWRDGAPLALVTGLRMRWPWPAPVIWSASSHPLRLVAALNAGAGGYVHVDAPLPDLMAVLRVAQRGGAACCALTAAALRARLFGCPSLTEREAQVAALVAAGHANTTIAATLGLTTRGVEAHLQRMFRKTGARTRVDLARWWLLRPWLCGAEDAPEAEW